MKAPLLRLPAGTRGRGTAPRRAARLLRRAAPGCRRSDPAVCRSPAADARPSLAPGLRPASASRTGKAKPTGSAVSAVIGSGSARTVRPGSGSSPAPPWRRFGPMLQDLDVTAEPDVGAPNLPTRRSTGARRHLRNHERRLRLASPASSCSARRAPRKSSAGPAPAALRMPGPSQTLQQPLHLFFRERQLGLERLTELELFPVSLLLEALQLALVFLPGLLCRARVCPRPAQLLGQAGACPRPLLPPAPASAAHRRSCTSSRARSHSEAGSPTREAISMADDAPAAPSCSR